MIRRMKPCKNGYKGIPDPANIPSTGRTRWFRRLSIRPMKSGLQKWPQKLKQLLKMVE